MPEMTHKRFLEILKMISDNREMQLTADEKERSSGLTKAQAKKLGRKLERACKEGLT